MMRLPNLQSLPAIASGAAGIAAVVARSGMIAPFLPRPELLGVIARAPFKDPSMGSAVALHAALRPSAVALVDDEGALTWAALNQRTQRLANALLEVASPGDRVAFSLRNGRENIECYTACGLAGLAAVPINTWSVKDEVQHIVDTQEPALIVADREFAKAVEGTGPDIWWTGDDGDYDAWLDAAAATPPSVRGGGRIVTHTSGTTGKPKGAERGTAGAAALTAFIGFLEKVPLRRSDVFFIVPPLFHQFAQGMLASALILGNTIVLCRRFDAAEFLQKAVENNVTAAALLPVMLKRIADLDGRPPAPQLRVAVVSGSALPEALRKRAERLLGDVFYDLYGSTEAGFATIATPEDQRTKPGSVGQPGRGAQVLIVDEDDNPVGPGEIGSIRVVSSLAFEGYTGAEADAADASRGVDIGDVGYLDEDGYLYVTGRSDDMIVSGGENIFPSEVEEVLEHHPDLADSAVIGVDDEEFGQVLHAFVVARGGAKVEQDDVRSFVRSRLARYKTPKQVTFLDELPRNAAGKVLKNELAASLG
jgi:fatty-acyl-CoA synthase